MADSPTPTQDGQPSAAKEGWRERAEFWARIGLPVVGLLFTAVFGSMGVFNQAATQRLATSNFELSQSQTKISLLPYLCSEDKRQRIMALSLAKALDPKFAVESATILAVNDPDKEVRQQARSILASLSHSPQEGIKRSAQKGVTRFETVGELRAKGLATLLQDAQGYVDGGATNGSVEAVKIYHEVLNQLSPEALAGLDQDLLREARADESAGRFDQSARKYRALFADYLQTIL